MVDQAIKKLREELKSGKFGWRAAVMKTAVCGTLENFCRQDEEFAQAVVQGGSFSDCMAAVAKKIKGNGISDMEAYGEAVRFYFPGAGIDVKMTIDLCASVRDKSQATEAAEALAERDRLREQLQIAEKKLALSDAAVARFGVLFQQSQDVMNKLLEAMGAVADADTAARLRQAAGAMLRKFLELVDAEAA